MRSDNIYLPLHNIYHIDIIHIVMYYIDHIDNCACYALREQGETIWGHLTAPSST